MNMHSAIQPQQRARRVRWKFKVGQIVDHSKGEVRSTIVSRERSFMGLEIYYLRPVGEQCRQLRAYRGDYLVAV